MDTKQQTLAAVLVIFTVAIGATFVAFNPFPVIDGNGDNTTDTTTDSTETEEEIGGRPSMFLKNQDLRD